MCKDIDTLPYSDLSGKNVFFIEDGQLKEEDPYITYIQKRNKYDFKAFRGCPFACSYCGNKSIRDVHNSTDSFMRKKSVDRVISELRYVLEIFPDIKTLGFSDEVFISNDKYTEEFAAKYKKEVNLLFTCDASLQLLTEENVSQMADAGLKTVNCGIEVFSEEVRLQVYKRKMNNKKIVEKSRILEKYNVFVMYDFIYDNPLETAKDIEECFWDLIIFLPRPCTFNRYSLSHLPKTELTERFLKEGRITEDDIVGMSDKGLVQWKVSYTHERDKNICFWLIVYDLFCYQIKFNKRSLMVPLAVVKSIASTRNHFLARAFQKFIAVVQVLIEGRFWRKVKGEYFSCGN
jgi:anaerobic magnesium-protoporphyrin IX monomethyl ester cyclase